MKEVSEIREYLTKIKVLIHIISIDKPQNINKNLSRLKKMIGKLEKHIIPYEKIIKVRCKTLTK